MAMPRYRIVQGSTSDLFIAMWDEYRERKTG